MPLAQRPRPVGELIPESVLTKAPSAELRPDQRDDQSLPPYEVLDPLIEAYVDGDLHRGATWSRPATTRRSCAASADWSTWPSTSAASRPPGIRVSQKAFGRDRRLPITNRYRAR